MTRKGELRHNRQKAFEAMREALENIYNYTDDSKHANYGAGLKTALAQVKAALALAEKEGA